MNIYHFSKCDILIQKWTTVVTSVTTTDRQTGRQTSLGWSAMNFFCSWAAPSENLHTHVHICNNIKTNTKTYVNPHLPVNNSVHIYLPANTSLHTYLLIRPSTLTCQLDTELCLTCCTAHCNVPRVFSLLDLRWSNKQHITHLWVLLSIRINAHSR